MHELLRGMRASGFDGDLTQVYRKITWKIFEQDKKKPIKNISGLEWKKS